MSKNNTDGIVIVNDIEALLDKLCLAADVRPDEEVYSEIRETFRTLVEKSLRDCKGQKRVDESGWTKYHNAVVPLFTVDGGKLREYFFYDSEVDVFGCALIEKEAWGQYTNAELVKILGDKAPEVYRLAE